MKADISVARNHLAQASILAQSFNEHNPEFPFHILVIDCDESDRNCFGPSAQIVLPGDLLIFNLVGTSSVTPTSPHPA